MKTYISKDTLLAFVDEIGDRGHSGKSSEYFAMSAVIFPASVQQRVKDCIANIKSALGINLKTALHWRQHCHRHDVRKYVAGEIAQLKDVTVIYVISDKRIASENHERFYNLVAALTMERILNHTEELNAKVTVRFGHIRGFDHSTTIDYFKKRDWRYCNYDRLINEPEWISADTNSGIQLADLYAGILGAAMIPDRFGNYEAVYLETIKHQIRKSNSGRISGYGIKAITWENNPRFFKWWPKEWE
jgi:hypothetical protein